MPQKIVFAESEIQGRPASATVTFSADEISAEPAAPSRQVPAPSWLELATEGVGGLISGINPVPLLKSIYEDSAGEMQKAIEAASQGDLRSAVAGAVKSSPAGQSAKVLGEIGAAQLEQLKKGKFAYDQGRMSEAFGHTLAGLLPVLGPVAGRVGEEVGTGDPRRMARAAGTATSLVAPSVIAKGLPKTVRVPGLTNPNPSEVAAVEFGQRRGVPVDAGTATGNWAVKGTQALADRSIGGSLVAGKARQAQGEALGRVGGELADQTYPRPVTAEQAGQGVRDTLAGVLTAKADEAGTAYDALRTIQADPKHAHRVTVGTRVEQSGVLDALGNPVTRTVPILETIAMPVSLREAKAMLKPIRDLIKHRWPIAQQQASPSLKALDNLVDGPDYAPASTVDANLSALKAVAREAQSPDLRTLSQGIAAAAVRKLSVAVDAAVAKAGPHATAALKAGRDATKAKYGAADVLKQLRDEPVQIFNQATWAKDAGIERLREVATLAPTEMPKIARAYLEDLLTTATSEGGFSRAQSLHTKWQKLGPQTKTLLFRNPSLVRDLDSFFLLAKRMADNPNPSGSGYVASLGAQGGLLVWNPATGIPIQLTGAVLSKLLHSSAGVKVLTRGLSIPVRLKFPPATTTAAQILKMAAEDASPTSALVPAMAGDETAR